MKPQGGSTRNLAGKLNKMLVQTIVINQDADAEHI